MVVGSTMFPRKDVHKYTWISSDQETRNQIDHVLIDARHTSSLMCIRTMRGANVDSDHHLVKAIIKARISNVRTMQQRRQKKLRIKALKNSTMKNKFCGHIKHLFETNKQRTAEQTLEQK